MQQPILIDREQLEVPAPPWHYNSSAWSQRIPVCILAMIGFLIASYMALYQWRLIGDVWDPVFGDQTKKVLDSDVSHAMKKWMLVPDAALGAFAYLGDAVFGLAGSTRRWQTRPWLVIIFGIDVIPLGIVSAVLVVLQGAVVGYWCFLCLVTAVISLTLIVFAYDEVYSSLVYLWRVWRESKSIKCMTLATFGSPNETAREVGEQMIQESLAKQRARQGKANKEATDVGTRR